ncbi:uncharacterized protein LOC134696315 [Mytilus trossulus]|uniref:uncharacterized protein LOC134696315 n=1 Tax=Mytilus trossulus TaxID=6551 RepID=UPI0030040A3D
MEAEEEIDILHCGICNNWLENPRYLTCLHSFCENCLEDWIAKTVKPNDNGIECKICKLFTSVSVEDKFDPKTWKDHMPRNNFISSLVEREKVTVTNETENFCRPCFDSESVKVSATHWCQQCSGLLCATCANFHKKVKNLASHKLHSVEEIKEHPEIISRAFELCETHPEEKIETYCYSHDEPCCVRCEVHKHRHCDDVIPIDKWVRETQNAQEPSELLQELDRRTEQENSKQLDVVKCLALNDEITKIRAKIDKHLNKIEKQLRDEITMFMETTENDKNKENSPIRFCKTYLQKLIKSGTSVQLLTSMKRIRILLAKTEKGNDKEPEIIYIKFDEHLKGITKEIRSFGHLVSDKKKLRNGSEISLNIPVTNNDEKRPPMKTAAKSEMNVPERISPAVSPKPARRKEQNDKPKAKHRKSKTGEDSPRSDRKSVKREKKKGPPPPKRGQSVKAIDNIAEIERKLKLFVDKHISSVDFEKKKREHIYSYADDDEVFGVEDQYAKVDKHGEQNRAEDTNKNNKSHQQQSNDSNDVVKTRHKRTETVKKKTDPLDPEKEKLNALISSYLRKKEPASNSLSNTKSFYFSTPDIPTIIKEDDNSSTNQLNRSDGRGSRTRRKSLQAAMNDEVMEDPDYDQIDYDSPFLDPTYIPMNSPGKKNKEKAKKELAFVETTKAADSTVKDSDVSSLNVPIAEFEVYRPESQLKATETNASKKKEAEKNKNANKKNFFDKAKEKLRFHKKNGKFDVEQSTKDKIFENDPMNDPIYAGTVRKAAHEITPKRRKSSPYEQNFEIIYQGYKDTLKDRDENPYETSFQLMSKDKQKEQNEIKEKSGIEKKRNDENNANSETEEIQVKYFEILDEQTIPLTPPDENINSGEKQAHKAASEGKRQVQMIGIKLPQVPSREGKRLPATPPAENQTLVIPSGEMQKPEPPPVGEKRPPMPKGMIPGMSVAFLGELQNRLKTNQPDKDNLGLKHTEDTDNHGHTLNIDGIQTKGSPSASPKPRKRPVGVPKVESTGNTQKEIEQSQSEQKMVPYEARSRNDFNVQSGDTFISGGVFNSKGKILLIDRNEKKLYIFTCAAECEDVLDFKEKPFDITVINENVVAVTFPDAKSVSLVDMIEMKTIKSLPVNECCFGITYQIKDLIIRCSESIIIMNLNGIVMRTIRVQTDFAGYLTCHEDRIYYTHKSSLICIDKTGNQIFTFEDPALERAEGLATDFEGNVYVAGIDSNNVWQISGTDGKQNRKIINVLISPKAIAFNETLNRFLVAYDKTNVIIYDLHSSFGSLI